jgi:hypothetical protein
VRELPEGDAERALTATGDAIVSAGGKVVEVSKDAGAAVADKIEDVPSEADDAARATAKGAKKVGTEAAGKAEDVGTATVNGRSGYTFTVYLGDPGESGRNDTFRIVITGPDGFICDSAEYDADGRLDSGNLQVHKK